MGFTLVELMVVVLIMGILVGVAYPTFAAVQNGGYDADARANATNALNIELSYYYHNLSFIDAGSCDGGPALDPDLPWGKNGSQNESVGSSGSVVVVLAGQLQAGTNEFYWGGGFCPDTTAALAPTILVEDLSASGDCFYVAYNMAVSPPVVGYAESAGPPGQAKCIDTNGAGVMEFPSTSPASGNAGSHIVSDADSPGLVPGDWYASF